MHSNLKIYAIAGAFAASLFATTAFGQTKNKACHAVYDAGSSGLRLYLYDSSLNLLASEKIAGCRIDQALENPGARICKLPNRSETFSVTLARLKQNNLPSSGCSADLASVQLYATAGIRLVEQELQAAGSTEQAVNFYAGLRRELSRIYPNVDNDRIEARTITGAVEGLFALLAVEAAVDGASRSNLGIVETGGASAQVAILCSTPEIDDIICDLPCDLFDCRLRTTHI